MTTCQHQSSTGAVVDGVPVWECDECGHQRPKTAREADWGRTDVPTCVRCYQSDAFGGPLLTVAGLLPGRTYLIHEGCRGSSTPVEEVA